MDKVQGLLSPTHHHHPPARCTCQHNKQPGTHTSKPGPATSRKADPLRDHLGGAQPVQANKARLPAHTPTHNYTGSTRAYARNGGRKRRPWTRAGCECTASWRRYRKVDRRDQVETILTHILTSSNQHCPADVRLCGCQPRLRKRTPTRLCITQPAAENKEKK